MAVPRYSANGQSRSVVIDSTGALIAQTIQPNVSNFGWTSNDLKSVTDLTVWVDTAQNAAQSASDNAGYVEQIVVDIQNLAQEVDGKLTEAEVMSTNLSQYVTDTKADMDAKVASVNASKTYIDGISNLVHTRGNWVLELYKNFTTMYEDLRTAFPDKNLPPSREAPDEPTA